MTDAAKDFARAVRSLFPTVRDWMGPITGTSYVSKQKPGDTDMILVYARGPDARALLEFVGERCIPVRIETPPEFPDPFDTQSPKTIDIPKARLIEAPDTQRESGTASSTSTSRACSNQNKDTHI